MTERAAILLVRRDASGQLTFVDASGKAHVAVADADLRRVLDAVLDDPEIPQVEQVARLEQTAEEILVQTTASLLPDVAKPLAGPLVRDIGALLRKATTVPRTILEQPAHQREARARSARMENSQRRIVTSGRRRGSAA